MTSLTVQHIKFASPVIVFQLKKFSEQIGNYYHE